MQYSILIFGTEGMAERLPKEEQDELMQGHYDLQDALRARGQFASIKLMPSSSAMTIKPKADSQPTPLVTDGPFTESKEHLLGFYIAEFDSIEEALSLADHISTPLVSLEVRPIEWYTIPGMDAES